MWKLRVGLYTDFVVVLSYIGDLPAFVTCSSLLLSHLNTNILIT